MCCPRGGLLAHGSGRSRKFGRGVHCVQLNRRGFTTPINYNIRLLTSIRALLLADVARAFCRALGIWWITGLEWCDWSYLSALRVKNKMAAEQKGRGQLPPPPPRSATAWGWLDVPSSAGDPSTVMSPYSPTYMY